MKRLSSVLLSAVLLAVIFPTLSHAALITENWVAYITNIYGENTENPFLEIGNEFNITFSYDDLDTGRTVTRASDGYTWEQLGSEADYKDITSVIFSSNLAAAVAASTYSPEYYQTFIYDSPYHGYRQFASVQLGYDLSVIDDITWNTSLVYNYMGGGQQQVNLKIKSSNIVDPIPEPATMLLFGTGLVGLVGSRLRKKKK